MRLDFIEDSIFKPNDEFEIEIKNKKCYFTFNGERYLLGSKLYPIGKRAHIFTKGNTKDIGLYDIAKEIEDMGEKPQAGYCYSNSEVLYNLFKKHGINAKYYSGWMFPGIGFPIHHAWVVVDNNIYDISVQLNGMKKMREQIEEGRDPYSKECVKEIVEIEKKWTPIEECYQWGQAEYIYVGSESTPNGARLQYSKAVDDVSTHPSYKSMGKTGKYIESNYQRLMRETKESNEVR